MSCGGDQASGRFGNPDQRGTQQAIIDPIAGLDFLHHGARLGIGRGDFHHRLMQIGVERHAHRCDAGDAVAFKQALQGFKALLVPHLLEEAIRLYTYLRQELKTRGDANSYQLVNGYKSEMKGIGDAAVHFVETYNTAANDAIDFEQVRASLHEIGHLLGDRIRREESELYPLYQSLH